MLYYSTKHESPDVSLEEAIFRGLPPDNGLYMPREIHRLPATFFEKIEGRTFNEIAFGVAEHLIGDDVAKKDLEKIIEKAFNFDSPVVNLGGDTNILELWHGPSMAFKDFGARFMAGLMGHFLERKNREIHILVATSGDTGGAVAQGFFDVPGIRVTILYPSGRVSPIQEKQLTTLGKNISAIEVAGDFDDCQKLVKMAFLDNDLRQKMTLASANSINIARLIPQTFYYFRAFSLLKKTGKPLVFSVPSGNFGNLSAGAWAVQMGLPVEKFIAATNENDAVPIWLATKTFAPKPTIATISNAMDVGNPSNFPRLEIFSEKNSGQKLAGDRFSDAKTSEAIRQIFEKTGYMMCPHTAVAWLGWEGFQKGNAGKFTAAVLSTAHPAKFLEAMEAILPGPVDVPARLSALLEKEKSAVKLAVNFEDFKTYLLEKA